MRSLALVPAFLLCLVGPVAGAAAKKKGPEKGAAPTASSDEVGKIKGDFRWGMSPDEVLTKMVEKVDSSFDDRLKKTATDPARQDRVRKEMLAEDEKVRKHSLVEFKGEKSGYDVSIIDQEFTQNAGESMLVGKDDNATRYFFFVDNRRYKMFIAFDKEMLAGKSFKDFGALMQARFGKAKEVYVDEKTKAGVQHKLDHYVWTTKGGDVLRLVDRSGFYDVYCLVIADAARAERQAEVHRARMRGEKADSLVEAVTNAKPDPRDSNDNVIDRITGRSVHRPGDEDSRDVKVPSPGTTPAATTPAAVTPPPVTEPAPSGEASKKGKDAKKKGNEKGPQLDI
jgi:hypothetical protein